MARVVMANPCNLVIDYPGQGFPYFDGKDIYTGRGQGQNLHIEPGLVHILYSLVDVVHGRGDGDHSVPPLDDNLPPPLILLHGYASGCPVLLQLFQKSVGIKMIMDIDFHSLPLFNVSLPRIQFPSLLSSLIMVSRCTRASSVHNPSPCHGYPLF